jgi:hypothetical protein
VIGEVGGNEYSNSVDVLALQDMKCTGTGIKDKGNHVILYGGHQTKQEFGAGFLVDHRIKNSIIGFTPISRGCVQ